MSLTEDQKKEMIQLIDEMQENITLMTLNCFKKANNMGFNIEDQLLIVNMGLAKSIKVILMLYPETIKPVLQKQILETILGEDKNGKSATI